MKNNADNLKNEIVTKYEELKSSYKVANFFNVSATAVKRILKNAGVLRTQKLAALQRDNSYVGIYIRTQEHIDNLSIIAKSRTKEKNSNYKHGKSMRKPGDHRTTKYSKVRNFVLNRDKYTCTFTGQVGGHLCIHHLIPYKYCPEAFLDPDNMITVSSIAHLQVCHKGDWKTFNVDLISETLMKRYSFDRERLNELASNRKMRKSEHVV